MHASPPLLSPLFLRPVYVFTALQRLKDASVLLFDGFEVGHHAIGGNDSGMFARNRSHISAHRSGRAALSAIFRTTRAVPYHGNAEVEYLRPAR